MLVLACTSVGLVMGAISGNCAKVGAGGEVDNTYWEADGEGEACCRRR